MWSFQANQKNLKLNLRWIPQPIIQKLQVKSQDIILRNLGEINKFLSWFVAGEIFVSTQWHLISFFFFFWLLLYVLVSVKSLILWSRYNKLWMERNVWTRCCDYSFCPSIVFARSFPYKSNSQLKVWTLKPLGTYFIYLHWWLKIWLISLQYLVVPSNHSKMGIFKAYKIDHALAIPFQTGP